MEAGGDCSVQSVCGQYVDYKREEGRSRETGVHMKCVHVSLTDTIQLNLKLTDVHVHIRVNYLGCPPNAPWPQLPTAIAILCLLDFG